MKEFGSAAVAAVKQYNQANECSPLDAWNDAVRVVFPKSLSMQSKSCPRGAFLGLCSDGLVAGIPASHYTDSVDNKRYAIAALSLIRRERGLISDRGALWRRATEPKIIAENSQLDVVLALWEAGFLVRHPHR